MKGSWHLPIPIHRGLAHSLPIPKGVADGDEQMREPNVYPQLGSTLDVPLYTEGVKVPTSISLDSLHIATLFSQPKVILESQYVQCLWSNNESAEVP